MKFYESHEYVDIGSWWERRRGKDANEVDIVGLRADGRSALVAEVKRLRRNYNHKQFMEKVERLRTAILPGYAIETRLMTLEDM